MIMSKKCRWSVVRFPDQACFIIGCKNLALNIRDCLSLCLSEETLKAVGPFYLVSMPWVVKYPSHTGLRERRDASATETDRLLRDFYNTLCSGHTTRLLRDSFTTDWGDRCTTVVRLPHELRDGSTTCTRPSRDYNTDTWPSYDTLATLPRPLRDAPRAYKKLILEELLQ